MYSFFYDAVVYTNNCLKELLIILENIPADTSVQTPSGRRIMVARPMILIKKDGIPFAYYKEDRTLQRYTPYITSFAFDNLINRLRGPSQITQQIILPPNSY
jgi:hypothetical protein